MLTADLVRARVQGPNLVISQLGGKMRERAADLAMALLNTVRDRIGGTREEVGEAVRALVVAPRERKLYDGLAKLVDDACEYSEAGGGDPVELRRAVFLAAAQARRELPDGADFDRAEVLEAVAVAQDTTPQLLENGLFGDLRAAHVLRAVAPLGPEDLVARYERAQVQAVLLKAVRVVALVHCSSAGAARALFRKLKFHRLLHTIEERGDGEYRITIDGPYSLFDSVTKYGLQLALVLPALEDCDRLELEAEVRWGKQRRCLTFRHEHRRRPVRESGDAVELPDEVRALRDGFSAMDTAWSVAVAQRVFALPGVGLCVPDLVFEHPDRSRPVHLEVLGYWSRAAVWQRVELVESGMREPVLFVVSARLRVSEEVLGDRESAALYVYKGAISPRGVERKLNQLAPPER